MDIVTRQFKYEYTEQEMEAFRDKAISSIAEIDNFEDGKKSAMAAWKDKIDSAKRDQKIAGMAFSKGYEFRDVQCEKVADLEDRMIRYVPMDNGEVLEEHPMTIQELSQYKQLTIELDGDKTVDEEDM